MDARDVSAKISIDRLQAGDDLGHALGNLLLVATCEWSLGKDLVNFGPAFVPHFGLDCFTQCVTNFKEMTAEPEQKMTIEGLIFGFKVIGEFEVFASWGARDLVVQARLAKVELDYPAEWLTRLDALEKGWELGNHKLW